MKRHGAVFGLRGDQVEDYKRLHAAVWPTVLQRIKESNISNYTIFLREPENLLFSYFEYTGTNFDADMAAMAADPETQRWWALCDPMRAQGDKWADVEEVFHLD